MWRGGHSRDGVLREKYFASQLAELVHPKDGHKKAFGMFQAYLDESGIHGDAHTCVVAGYSGSVSNWKKFERRWRRLLQLHRIDEFHAQRFWSYQQEGRGKRASPFHDWTPKQAEEFQEEAFSIIQESRLAPLAAAVPLRAWLELPMVERHFLTGGDYDPEKGAILHPGAPKKSYYLALVARIWNAAQRTTGGAKIHFVLDENNSLAPYAVSLFTKLRNESVPRVRSKLGQISFASSHDATPLQAADMLAYQLYLHVAMRKTHGDYCRNPNLDQLLLGLRSKYDIPLHDSEGLKLLLRDVFGSREECP